MSDPAPLIPIRGGEVGRYITGDRNDPARPTVYKMAARGDIEIVNIGRRAYVTRASIDAYLDRIGAGAEAVTA